MEWNRDEIPLYSLSISHKQAPLEVRKLFSFTREEEQRFLQRMIGTKEIDGAVLVSTCNRTEVYFSGKKEAVIAVERLLAEEKGVDIHLLRKYYRSYHGEKVIKHLFHVISGLDSMVLGEDEILGQMREAYKLSCEERCTDYYINTIFQRALNCAKQIKTQTCLSKSSVSIATLSASEITHFREGKKEILLLGATGQMGSLIAKNLMGREDIKIYATMRKHHGGACLEGIEEIPYEKRYEYIDRADIVVSATASPHYTITYEDCKKAVRTSKERLFLDIAVPNDIDPDIVLLSEATLRNIDYFQTIAKEHNQQKEEGRGQAEGMIEEECRETAKELLFHSFAPNLPEFSQRFKNKNAQQIFYMMRDAADTEELEALLSICGKLLAEEEKHSF